MKNNNFKKTHQGPKRRIALFGPDIVVVVFLDGEMAVVVVLAVNIYNY